MAILANRVKIKSESSELGKFVFFYLRKIFTTMLVFVCCVMLYFSHYFGLTATLLDYTGKVMSLGNIIYGESVNSIKSAYSMIYYFRDLQTENLKLKLQIAELIKEKDGITLLKNENSSLRNLLNIPKEPDSKFVTARIVSTAINPFSNSAIIQAGQKEGLKVDDIVLGPKGLIGRIVEVGTQYSSIILVSDHNSRIPVMTEDPKVRGILTKQDIELKIIYLKEGYELKVGEIVYTSGDGKLFPRGIPIATVINVRDKEAVVAPLDNINEIDFVMVLTNEQQGNK